MATNNITISDFIQEYSSAVNDAAKTKICQHHLTRNYVPVLEKYTALAMGVNKSSRDDNGVVHLNSFMGYVMYVIISLSLYYDFINVDESHNYMDIYDALTESGIRDTLLLTIGEGELNELQTINEFILADMRDNELSTQSFVASQFSRLIAALKESLTPEGIANIKSLMQQSN